jgi:hypothetical protein
MSGFNPPGALKQMIDSTKGQQLTTAAANYEL